MSELGKGGYLVPTAGLATRGGLDRYRISPTHYQIGTPHSPRSKSAGRTMLQAAKGADGEVEYCSRRL